MGTYARPTTIDDAVAELASSPKTILAGGTDIYPSRVGRLADDDVLDISGLRDLRDITFDDGRWRIPALATWTDVVRCDLPARFDGLTAAARAIGGVQIQNRATVCGNVCNASPAADGMPNLIALDAAVELVSAAGRREMPVGEFVTGNRRTQRRDGELVTAVLVPAADRTGDRARGTFLKLGSRAYLVISIVMVAVVIELDDDGRIDTARIAVGACSEVARRVPTAEARLRGHRPSRSLASTIGPGDLDALAPIDDIRGTATYRRDAASVLVRRAVEGVLS
jgi:CO/xanthine dehydrogenase FAD-binding subunit